MDPKTNRFAPYRGALRAAIGRGNTLTFVTSHPEGQATPLYRLELDKAELGTEAMPCGASALVADEGHVYVAGTDGHVYRGALEGGKLAPIGSKLSPAPIALALLDGTRLAALAGAEVILLDRKSGAAKQRFSLPDDGTAIASDASGKWLAAGTARGTLAVFDAEERAEFIGGESKKLHEGAIGSLLFDPDELRVYSTGSDGKLLLTHVRGALEPDDRTGGGGHDGQVTAIAVGPEDKLYTAGRDGTIKTWSRGASKRRPSTLKDGVPSAVALARVEWKSRPHLAVLGEDRTIRVFPMDAGGKLGERVLTFHDAYARARSELGESEPARRKEALEALAGYNDGPAIEILAAQASADPDHALKVLATKLLGDTRSERAKKPLETLLGAPEEQVRLAALAALRALYGSESLRPLELSLAQKKRDIGAAAVTALAELATADELAMARLTAALDDDPVEVRAAAVAALEALHDARAGKKAPSPESGIVALRSKRADIRRLSLVRFFQRKLLGESEVLSALRRHEGDPDADVRRAAFLVAVMSRPALADALRARDRDLHRQLWELETFGQKAAAEAEPPKVKKGKVELGADDTRPLLEALASRSLDTCLLGARGLAALQDERAFGTLLQLTNEKQPAARVEACKALADLGDPRCAPRLRQMLRDQASDVRDAAFSALVRIEEKTPLSAAEAGLLAPAEDVRGRGLTLLVRHLKKEPPKGDGGPAVALLLRALDDTAASVRSEAWKAALGLSIGGEGAAPLRFALRSIHADVRREVLGEAMGRISEAWAPGLVLELFADPDAAVRNEAFENAQKRGKGKAIEPLSAALSGRWADLKLKAIDALSKKRVEGVRELLQKALDDEDEKVRTAAASALSADELEGALSSPHADVRVRAAALRATLGDEKARGALLALATEKEPEIPEKRAAWVDRVTRALGGLGELGASSPDVVASVASLLVHKEKPIREAAARALGWIARPGGDLTALREALSHSDAEVKQEAAFGLALAGDPSSLPLLKGLTQASAPVAMRCLYAAIALGKKADDLLMAFLDHPDDRVRGRALILMMLIEASEQDGLPDRCLAALSSSHPRVRLTAARALETFADAAGFAAFVTELVNDRGEDKAAWTIAPSVVRALGEIFTSGDSQLKGRAARLLDALDDEKQDRFDRAWESFQKRFGKEIDKLVKDADKRRAPAAGYAPEELARVVLGAYAGLSRMVGGPLEMRVRQTAVARLSKLGRAGGAAFDASRPLLLLALGDPAREVRKLAFDSLVAMGMPAADLGAEALAVGQRDVGALGLELLAGATAGDAGAKRKVLEQVFLGNTDGLEDEAEPLLVKIDGPTAVHAKGLEARSQTLRERSVGALATRYDEDEAARKALRAALSSRFRHVRDRAAIELAGKKDPAGFDALVEMLRSPAQKAAIAALSRLGDPRAPDAMLDRIETDPAGDALTDALFEAAGYFRLPATVDRLLAHLADKKRRRAANLAVVAVSGYDQAIPNPDDDRPDLEIRFDHPRRDDVLAKLVDALHRLGDVELASRLIPSMRWAKGREVDAVLAPLTTVSRDEVRHAALEAAGFRLRKRGGPAEPLITALSHANPLTQFAAAEALALAGRADGIRVLLTSIDLVPELDQRRRAVRALGRLGDARALDMLLRLAGEEGHALQEEAAEAIGNLRATPKADRIEELLLGLAKGSGGVALSALTGLRWFDSKKAWDFLRSRVADPDVSVRARVVSLLAFDADPASRAAIVKRIEEEPVWAPANAAAEALRQWEPEGSLEPDYVLLGALASGLGGPIVERLRERGDPARILDALGRIRPSNEGYVRPLITALLARDPLPLEAAAAHLPSADDRVAAVSAQIVGRAGKGAGKAHGKSVATALTKALEGWRKELAEVQAGRVGEGRLGPITVRVQRLVGAAGKLEVAPAEVVAATTLGGEDARARSVRIEALSALASGWAKQAGLEALVAAVSSHDARARAIASAAVHALAPDRAAALAASATGDLSTLALLVGKDGAPSLAPAAASVHTQGTALPFVVAANDVAGLQKILSDRKLPESARLGAAEALGRIGTDAALAALYAAAKAEGEDEELSKAAYRAARRGRRYQAKRSEKREVVS